MRYGRFTQEQVDFLIQNYPIYGGKFCALKLNKSIYSIHNKVHRLGLLMTPKSRSDLCIMAFAKNFEEYNVNPLYFLNITRPEISYILGLLWADGNISFCSGANIIQLTCTPPDSYEYLKIFNRIGIWKFYEYQDKKHPFWKPRTTILTNNKIIAEFLKSKSYCSKSGDSGDLILECIPDEIKRYWFRGLFDGDGCLYIKDRCQQLCISGPYEQNWDFIEKLFKKLEVNYKIKHQISKKGHKSSCIRVCSRKGILKFLNFIYKDASDDDCYLSRKYNKYLELIEIEKKYLQI